MHPSTNGCLIGYVPWVPSSNRTAGPNFSDVCGEMPVTGYIRDKYSMNFTGAANKLPFIDMLPDKAAEAELPTFESAQDHEEYLLQPEARTQTDKCRDYGRIDEGIFG
jgi:hypothetical protein